MAHNTCRLCYKGRNVRSAHSTQSAAQQLFHHSVQQLTEHGFAWCADNMHAMLLVASSPRLPAQ